MSKRKKRPDIYVKYRSILRMPALSKKSIEEMRRNLGLIAHTICEHVWKKKYY